MALARAAGTSLRRRYETITPSGLADLMASSDSVTIVDVRLPSDFESGHIEGAINIPYIDFDAHAADVPRGPTVVAVCYLGMLSRTAAQRMVADGHVRVLNLDRGMAGWRDHAAHLDNAG